MRYFVAGNGGGGGGRGNNEITEWVTAEFEAVTIGGQTVYDLSA